MPTISQKDYETMQRMIAEDPNISFGARDPRNPDVTVGSKPSTPPASSGGGGSKTPSNSGSRVSPPSSKSDGVMPSSSRGGGSSSNTRSIDPNLVTGYDPNWFSSLSPEIQQKAQAERQRSGYVALPTDRPLAWEESFAGGALPSSYEDLPERIQNIVGEAEQRAFSQWAQQQPVIPPQGLTPEQFMSMWQQQLDEALFPYQQQLQQLMAKQPAYTPPAEEEMLQLAQQYAGLQINPRLQAIQRQLEQYEQQAEAERARIEAAYATVPEQTQQQLDEARRYALESAIARGAGRSGVVDWTTEKSATPIMTQAQQAEAEKASRLADIESALRTAQQQAAEQQLALEEQRGDLQQQYLQTLREQAYARATGDWQREFDAAQRLAELATQAYQWGETAALNWAPYFITTEAERQELPQTWTDIIGEVPSSAPSTTIVPAPLGEPGGDYLVAVRDYLGGRANVAWDPVTGEVIVNGRRFKPEDVGGRVSGGTALVPKSFLDNLLQGVI